MTIQPFMSDPQCIHCVHYRPLMCDGGTCVYHDEPVYEHDSCSDWEENNGQQS